MLRSFICIGLVLLPTILVWAAEPEAAPPPRRIPVEEWIIQLGGAKFAEREAATNRLSKLTFDPPPELLAATKSEDPDVRERAARAFEAMRWNALETRVRGHRFAKQNRVDLFVAASAVWDLKADDARVWEPTWEFGQRLIEKAEMKGERKPHNCPSSFKDFATYQRLTPSRFTRMDELYRRPDIWRNESIQASGIVDAAGLHSGIILSRGSIDTKSAIQMSVVLANGNVTAATAINESVIICDGDVSLTDRNISRSLVLARGEIIVKGGATQSVLMAGGKVTLGVDLTAGPDRFNIRFNVIKENAANPLGITFFELSTVGVEVKAEKGVVLVSAIANGKAFAKVGVQVGDTVITVNGNKPDSAESLRRLLRDVLAIGDATVTLKRGDKTETVKLTLLD